MGLGKALGSSHKFTSCLRPPLVHKDYLACLDDLLARRFAEQLGLRVIGIVGVLLKAKQKGIISGINPVLDHLRREGFHLGDDVISEALHLAGEESESGNES